MMYLLPHAVDVHTRMKSRAWRGAVCTLLSVAPSRLRALAPVTQPGEAFQLNWSPWLHLTRAHPGSLTLVPRFTDLKL